jgi:isochorismate synthase
LKPAKTKDISTFFQEAQAEGLAFVAFRLPGAARVNHLSGAASRQLSEGETAFAFAPFDPKHKPYYIKAHQASSTGMKAGEKKEQKSTIKKQFTDLVGTIISAIKSGEYKKIVAARVLAMPRPDSFDPLELFDKLCLHYPVAFVSLTYIPTVGLWIGASPEVLVSETPKRLSTYSLAGTKAIDDESEWTEKEREEQQIVTDFIHKKLEKAVSGKISVKGPLSHEAGSIKHLLSVFSVPSEGESNWKSVVKALHPTPAVSGMPQQKAVKFVKEKEGFDRSFYAGYLGPVNWKGRSDLFVNLRCMEVTDTQLLFYAGCGITSDSNPEKEWQESERKIDVLKSLI